MDAVYESSKRSTDAHVSVHKYKNLINIPHYHDDYEVICVEAGTAKLTVNKVSYALGAGDVAFVHENESHSIHATPDSVVAILKAEGSFFGHLFPDKKLASPVLRGTYFSSGILEEIRRELSRSDAYGSIIADGTVTLALCRMLRDEPVCEHKRESDPVLESEAYHRIREKISKEYATLTFSQAAEFLYFSKPYFSKTFHNTFGMTFTEYLNTVKIGMAIKMIQKGEENVTKISSECGFNTIRNFNRIFKKMTGHTPSELPKNYVFLYRVRSKKGLDPTLNCSELIC